MARISAVAQITGASGFIGGAVAGRLIDRAEIRGLTSHPARNRFGERVRSFAYDFANPGRMASAFRGVDVFVNSYYVRFNYGGVTFEDAGERTRLLIDQAKAAGVARIVHVSVSNASEASNLPYYANKARIERMVADSGLDYTILRPAWLNDHDEIDYGTTEKGQPFENADKVLSRRSVADLVVKLATTPGLEVRRSLGVHKIA